MSGELAGRGVPLSLLGSLTQGREWALPSICEIVPTAHRTPPFKAGESQRIENSDTTKPLVLASQDLFGQRFRPSILHITFIHDDLLSWSLTTEAQTFPRKTLYYCVKYSGITIMTIMFIMTVTCGGSLCPEPVE